MTDTNWAGVLDQEDVEALWSGLYQLISRHPAVRPLHFATDGAAVSSPVEINADLTQELFLELFQKQRFDHYVNTGYTSTEIENELAHIEIPNLVGARLRKRYPESFRMARRISSLLKTSTRFRRFGADEESEGTGGRKRGRPAKASKPVAELKSSYVEDDGDSIPIDSEEEGASSNGHSAPRRGRMVNRIFGLKEWKRTKAACDSGHFQELARAVPMRRRDTRIVGRSGTSQLILSNPELESLIVEVFVAIDSPTDVRTIRQLVLSKIPLQDYNVASLDEELNTGGGGSMLRRDPSDTRETPEAQLLTRERHVEASKMAGEFLTSLRRAVNNNSRRFSRLLSTLWYCYYDPSGPSQLEIAQMLGVSDSLVSDNRRLIEYELKKLRLSREDGPVFSESLQRLIVETSVSA
ncbi:MAG TPA: hypothetical protein VG778_00165 [Blastocatellia bacterium]|nr:hypothetical protein [Blastocatellia bacterium]